MNKKQKMIKKMWENYTHNCKVRGEKPLYNYRRFKWAYRNLNFKDLYNNKEFFKGTRIYIDYKMGLRNE